METPRVKFIEIPIDLEINMIYWFLFEHEWGWGRVIIKRHPALKPIYKLKQEKERIKFLKNYILDFRKKHRKKILFKMSKIQNGWSKIEKEFLITLGQVINTNWSEKRKEIKAMISINPIGPRFLDDWSFSLPFRYDDRGAKHVIMHEICHFLYFKKWKELFPNSKRRTYDAPYIEWHLSELSAPIILNDKRIKVLLKRKATFYREHQRVKIKGISAPQYFSNLYANCLKKNKNFDYFIKEAYKIIKKNKKLFLNIKK